MFLGFVRSCTHPCTKFISKHEKRLCLCPPRTNQVVSCQPRCTLVEEGFRGTTCGIVCVHRDQMKWFLASLDALLWKKDFGDSHRMHPSNLFPTSCQHQVFRQVFSVDIVQESTALLQQLLVLLGVNPKGGRAKGPSCWMCVAI